MKKLSLFILGIIAFSATSFAQITEADVPTADQFVAPSPTGANMTVGFNSTEFDAYAGGVIAAFYDLNGDGSPQCVGAYNIAIGFMGAAIWGDDSTTPEIDGLTSGQVPNFFIAFNDAIYYVDEIPAFSGYTSNSIVTINGGTVSEINDSFWVGCGLDTYLEYNPSASTIDNDLCVTPKVDGCMDDSGEACNYNSDANFDDGSCVYADNACEVCEGGEVVLYDEDGDGYCDLGSGLDPLETLGCTDPNADNTDSDATEDDGSCFREGCMSEWADNYDELATVDDNSCSLSACTNPDSDNYDSNATEDDGSCFREGCMSEWADNYDELATQDTDNVCSLLACTNPDSDNYDSNATDDDGSCFREGCMVSYMDNYDELATQDTDDVCFREGCMLDYMDNYDDLATQDTADVCFRVGCLSDLYFEYDSLATQDNFNDQCLELIVDGCYNPIAENYNPDANNGDQAALCVVSQIDPNVVTVTSNNMSVLFPASNASMFDENSDLVPGDIVFAVYEKSRLDRPDVGFSAPSEVASAGSVEWTGETVGVAVFGADGLEDNGYYEAEPLVWLIARGGVVYNATVSYNDENTSNSVGQYSEGSYISVKSIYLGTPFYDGCTNPNYYNFNPLAANEDGSCEGLISFGCNDTTYVNYAGCDLDTTMIDVNADNYGNAFGQNVLYNLNTGGYDGLSGVCAEFNAAEICQTELEGCTDPMANNYNPKATVNKNTICDWSINGMVAYDVDAAGNIIQSDDNYNFGVVVDSNVNDGFINSNFHYAHTFTDDNDGDAVFSHTDHVIDVLAKVFEWIEDDEEADSLLHEHMLDSIYFTLDSAATAFRLDEEADSSLLAQTIATADSLLSATLDSAATAFRLDEEADSSLLAQTIADADSVLSKTIADADALLEQTIADANALLEQTINEMQAAFDLNDSLWSDLQSATLDTLNHHRDPIKIDLKEGWNTIGYYLQHPSSAVVQFEEQFPVVENDTGDGAVGGAVNSINIVKDNVGNFWWPDFQFDGLGNLIPGQGYQVRVKDGHSKSDFIFSHDIGEASEYRTLDPTVPQWAIDMPVDIHPNDLRTLIRVVNMLGQEVVPEYQFKGEVLLYLYNDGTVEKKIVQ